MFENGILHDTPQNYHQIVRKMNTNNIQGCSVFLETLMSAYIPTSIFVWSLSWINHAVLMFGPSKMERHSDNCPTTSPGRTRWSWWTMTMLYFAWHHVAWRWYEKSRRHTSPIGWIITVWFGCAMSLIFSYPAWISLIVMNFTPLSCWKRNT